MLDIINEVIETESHGVVEPRIRSPHSPTVAFEDNTKDIISFVSVLGFGDEG